MSYLTLARRYRPRRFEEVRGQEPVVQALGHALEADQLHPALLLCGTRGVGKTTLGRIIAKCLNCEQGVSAHACGQCDACREVDEGRFIDLIEIDAASRTKVEDTRQLLDNVAYAPARGRYKVYLIDEVHMLSTSSFNALLKTLEEPPPHVKFILATTDPQKLPATVLSRCLKFNLRRLPVALIREVLSQVLEQEKLEGDDTALAVLARAADGSMRDGLSLLDQAIAYSSGAKLEREAMETMLGTTGRHGLMELLAAIQAQDGERLMTGLDELAAIAPDYAALLDILAADLQRMAVLQVLPAVAGDEDDPHLAELSAQITPEDVQLHYEIAVHAARDLRWAPDPRVGFEMALLRMYAFRPETSPAESAPAPRAKKVPARSAAPGSEAAAGTEDGTHAKGQASGDLWPRDVDVLGLAGLTRELARNCACKAIDDEIIQLVVDDAHAHLRTEERRVEIEQALEKRSGQKRRVQFSVHAVLTELDTQARVEARGREQRQQQAREAIESSEAARALRTTFDGRLQPDSVQVRE